MNTWNGKRVLILGAARQGLALARFLSTHGARVTLNDQRTPEQMQKALESMADYPVTWELGGHPLSLLDETDLVCLSGGVPLDLPIVAAARQRGLPLSNNSQIFMEAVPCRVVGITGSAGKTTTTTLVGRMAQAAAQAPRSAWVGGNIGLPLIEYLDQISPDDLVILELSSFQLELMTRSPQVAAILNVTPNHLDRHGTMEAYTAAKARLIEFQGPQDAAVLGREDPGAWALRGMTAGKLVSFGLQRPERGMVGTFAEDGALYLNDGEQDIFLLQQASILLRGEHNLLNVLAACAVAYAAGLPPGAMAEGVKDFGGVAHRLELVRSLHGANWYNDSIATAPERTIAAIRSFDEPLVLLLGGRDKNLPWSELARLVRCRVDHLIVFGEAAPIILDAVGVLEDGRRPYTLALCSGLKEAVEAAAAVAEPGDQVLLSPGGTSFDEFRDFEERGEVFRKWVQELS